MAMTPEEKTLQEQEFANAFNQESATKREMTEDEAFGLTEPEKPADEQPASEPAAAEPAAAIEAAEGDAGAQGEPPAVAVVIEPAATDGTDVAAEDEPTDPKDVQRAKSWEGRLKKREEELAARERALAERETSGHQGAENAAGGEGAEPAAEAVAEAVEKVEAGTMTPDRAIKTLSEDFGPEFANILTTLIEAKATEIAGRAADERVGKVGKTIDALIAEIVDDKHQEHFESIADAHPDFEDLAGSEAFRGWIEAMEPEARAAAIRTIDNGSSRAIVKLLNAFKAEQAKEAAGEDPAASEVPEGADAAEGVRSGGLRLPEEPGRAEGYEEAWDKF
jgi:hypothetical protein